MKSSRLFSLTAGASPASCGSSVRANTHHTHQSTRWGRRGVHTVVMIRHGESSWNVEKRFTGWCDVPLTDHGEVDAHDAGVLMGERGMKFDVAFTSTLERAWRTCAIALSAAGQSGSVETLRSWKLNERHYGALQGHLKDSPKLTELYGEQKILEWRKSYHTAPPSLYDADFARDMGPESFKRATVMMNPAFLDHRKTPGIMRATTPAFNPLSPPVNFNPPVFNSPRMSLDDLEKECRFPPTESLKQCEDRAFGYWNEVIAPRVKAGERVLIVAHANTIRALVKAVDQIDDSLIAHLKIPNGIPLVYTMDKDLNPILDFTDDLGFQANYLVSARNHGKMMAYERCVRKKLRSLFEYLDTDNDGRITPSCLQSGLIRLQNYSVTTDDLPQICEYEIEELLRCVPSADEHGGVTLKAFLESEATLLPKLSKLRLLQ